MRQLFFKYFSIGLVNTAVHWFVFSLVFYFFAFSQAKANLSGFIVAVTFSFFANAKFTFKQQATGKKYFLFVIFMGALNTTVGYVADYSDIHPVATLVLSSLVSLILGFLYSKFLVFNK